MLPWCDSSQLCFRESLDLLRSSFPTTWWKVKLSEEHFLAVFHTEDIINIFKRSFLLLWKKCEKILLWMRKRSFNEVKWFIEDRIAGYIRIKSEMWVSMFSIPIVFFFLLHHFVPLYFSITSVLISLMLYCDSQALFSRSIIIIRCKEPSWPLLF